MQRYGRQTEKGNRDRPYEQAPDADGHSVVRGREEGGDPALS